MSRPVVRILTAAWPGPTRPRRARFLETLHRATLDHFECEVLAPLVYESDPANEERHGIHVQRFPYPSGGATVKSRGISPLAAAAYCASMVLAARERWSDRSREQARGGCVFAHWVVPAGWIAARVAKRLQLPLVLYAHGSDVNVYARSMVGRRMLRSALHRASLLFVASHALAEVVRSLVRPPPPIVVLPVGVDGDFSAADAPPTFDGTLRVLFVGDPIDAKGAPLVARAMSECHGRGVAVRLDWIGRGDSDEAPEGVGTMRGDLSAAEVRDAMTTAHLLLLPSQNEGTPLVLQEAIACALPWAATPVGGIPALADQFPGGTLLPLPTDSDAVVQAIVALVVRYVSEGAEGVRSRWRAMAAVDTHELTVAARTQIFIKHMHEVLEWAS
mgnify:CR=1 FL=1